LNDKLRSKEPSERKGKGKDPAERGLEDEEGGGGEDEGEDSEGDRISKNRRKRWKESREGHLAGKTDDKGKEPEQPSPRMKDGQGRSFEALKGGKRDMVFGREEEKEDGEERVGGGEREDGEGKGKKERQERGGEAQGMEEAGRERSVSGKEREEREGTREMSQSLGERGREDKQGEGGSHKREKSEKGEEERGKEDGGSIKLEKKGEGGSYKREKSDQKKEEGGSIKREKSDRPGEGGRHGGNDRLEGARKVTSGDFKGALTIPQEGKGRDKSKSPRKKDHGEGGGKKEGGKDKERSPSPPGVVSSPSKRRSERKNELEVKKEKSHNRSPRREKSVSNAGKDPRGRRMSQRKSESRRNHRDIISPRLENYGQEKPVPEISCIIPPPEDVTESPISEIGRKVPDSPRKLDVGGIKQKREGKEGKEGKEGREEEEAGGGHTGTRKRSKPRDKSPSQKGSLEPHGKKSRNDFHLGVTPERDERGTEELSPTGSRSSSRPPRPSGESPREYPREVSGPARDVTGPARDVTGPARDVTGPARDVAGPPREGPGSLRPPRSEVRPLSGKLDKEKHHYKSQEIFSDLVSRIQKSEAVANSSEKLKRYKSAGIPRRQRSRSTLCVREVPKEEKELEGRGGGREGGRRERSKSTNSSDSHSERIAAIIRAREEKEKLARAAPGRPALPLFPLSSPLSPGASPNPTTPATPASSLAPTPPTSPSIGGPSSRPSPTAASSPSPAPSSGAGPEKEKKKSIPVISMPSQDNTNTEAVESLYRDFRHEVFMMKYVKYFFFFRSFFWDSSFVYVSGPCRNF
jgi:hypothetical protein